jgi:hypothetical protein
MTGSLSVMTSYAFSPRRLPLLLFLLEISHLVAIEGADFAAAYFSIWQGNKPMDKNLKKALLKKRKWFYGC